MECLCVRSKFYVCNFSNQLHVSMFYRKTNILQCSDEKKEPNCTENWGYENCGQMKDAKYKNYGCKFLNAAVNDRFECANRMDKSGVLFTNPPVQRTKEGQANFQQVGMNMNQVLIFDEKNIYCGERNITYEELSEVVHFHGYETCQLKNGMHLTLLDIWVQLVTDFSFKMSSKLDEL